MDRAGKLGMQQAVLVIGFGNMGQALVRGWLARGRSPTSICVLEPVAATRAIATQLRLEAFAEAATLGGDRTFEVVLLAVKPSQIGAALAGCAKLNWVRDAVFLSIAAGKTIAQIADVVGERTSVVRAMPNTPAAIGRGITALTANERVSLEQRELCADLMRAVGEAVWLDDERLMDAVTAVSGSGPAYVFLLIECLERAALDLGLDPVLAARLALATVAGSAEYAAVAGVEPAELRRRVTSPKGTTQAALDVLMAPGGLADLMLRAVRAAAERGRELSAS